MEERGRELERETRRGEEEREEMKRRWEGTMSECLFQSKENESLRRRLEEMEEEFEEKDVSFEQLSAQLEEGMKREKELRERLKGEEAIGLKLKRVMVEKERERQQIGNSFVALKKENADLEVFCFFLFCFPSLLIRQNQNDAWQQTIQIAILENEKQELILQLEVLLLRADYSVSFLSFFLFFLSFFLYFSFLSFFAHCFFREVWDKLLPQG